MTKWLLAIIIVLLVLVGGYYIYQRYNSPSTTSATATSSPSADINSVSIVNMSFSPNTITVPIGATVVWTNTDSVAHTLKSDAFESGTLNPGDAFDFAFTNAGTYNYSCGIHPSMQGTVVVQ
jgi:plastocyanin